MMNHPSGRWLRNCALGAGAVVLSAGLLAGCASGTPTSSHTAGLKTIHVALGWIPNVEFAGYWLADNEGYYAKEGLKIDWIPGGPNAPAPESSVAAGTADLGVSPDTKTLIDASKENNFVLIGTTYQSGPGCLLSMTKDPVTNVSDLSGKTFLAQDEAVVKALFAVNDLKPDYKFVPTSFDPGPLVQGQGDAYTAYITNQAVAMELQYGLKKGKDFNCVLYSKMNYPSLTDTLFGTRKYVNSNRDAVEGFLRASAKGWLENAKDPAKAAHLAVDKYGADLGLKLDQQITQNKAQIPLTHTDYTDKHGILRIDDTYLGGPIYKALRASGSKNLPPVKDIVDQTYLDNVYQDGLNPTVGSK
jgi:ABC-type nitrate/sulfonate/bicarbonate transport system substrate-binding protein